MSVYRTEAERRADANAPARVRVVDFDIPFWQLVFLLLKLALAVIPAFIVLAGLGLIFMALFGGLLVGLVGR